MNKWRTIKTASLFLGIIVLTIFLSFGVLIIMIVDQISRRFRSLLCRFGNTILCFSHFFSQLFLLIRHLFELKREFSRCYSSKFAHMSLGVPLHMWEFLWSLLWFHGSCAKPTELPQVICIKLRFTIDCYLLANGRTAGKWMLCWDCLCPSLALFWV